LCFFLAFKPPLILAISNFLQSNRQHMSLPGASALQIGQDLLHILYVGSVGHCCLTEISLSLGALLGQNMTLISLVSLKLSCACSLEALCCSTACLHLGHVTSS